MWKMLLLPTKTNCFLWVNAFFLILLVALHLADPLTIVFGYFLETIIIGVIHLVKLGLVSKYGRRSIGTSSVPRVVSLMLFFTAHYGMFVALQSIFAFALFQSMIGFKIGFDIFYNYKLILGYEGMPIILAYLILSNCKDFYTNFLENNKFRDYSPENILMKPYLRIFIQQFVVILGFFFYLLLNDGLIAATLLIFFRLFVDLILISIKTDSRVLDILTKKIAKSPEQYSEISRQLQEYSE